jgi:CheY-like chemotaxis protein
MLALRCRRLGLNPRIARSASCAVTLMAEERPDLILIDIEIPVETGASATPHGLIICEKLQQSIFSEIPVIVLSGNKDDEIIARCRLAGAVYVQKGPNACHLLKAEIMRLMNFDFIAADPQTVIPSQQLSEVPVAVSYAPKILCVDDDPDINLAVGMRLRQLGAHPIRAFSGAQGFRAALEERPDLILTDLHMPGGEGNYLIGRLKSNSITRDIPVIVLTAVVNPGMARELRSLGAEGYLMKPLDIPMVVAELRRFVKLPNL